jgi:hypothetical protein
MGQRPRLVASEAAAPRNAWDQCLSPILTRWIALDIGTVCPIEEVRSPHILELSGYLEETKEVAQPVSDMLGGAWRIAKPLVSVLER